MIAVSFIPEFTLLGSILANDAISNRLSVETVAVLALPGIETKPLLIKLVGASILMITTGYPGEISNDFTTRIVWGTISTIPFTYILYVLWVELSKSLERQPAPVQELVRSMRLLLLLSWGVYPIAYILPLIGVTGNAATVSVQLGYTIADVLAKPIFGLYSTSGCHEVQPNP